MDTTTGLSSEAADGGNRDERISDRVIEEVAAVKGVDPLDLDPLSDAIDPDALNAFFRRTDDSPAPDLTVHFTMDGCDVLVRGDGEVSVIPPLELDESPTQLALTED